MYCITTIGAPEVAYTFTIAIEDRCDDSVKNNSSIRFKLDEGEYGTWDQLIASLKALAGHASGTKNYAAGELPAAFTETANTHTVYWKWAITDPAHEAAQDAADTAMGDASQLPQCFLQISIIASQID